ncbi:MAG: hypothetical protein Kapaf2KO_02590 [Candidatus Kapaibacteriales bacterium]
MPNQDSLLRLLEEQKSDSSKAKKLLELSYDEANLSIDQRIFFAKKGLEYTDSLGWKYEKGKFYNSMGTLYSAKGNYQKAIDNLLIALEISNSLKKTIAQAITNLSLAQAYMMTNDYADAKKNLKVALRLFEKEKDSTGIADCYAKYGLLYYYQSELPKALESLYQGLRISEKIDNKWLTAECYANIGLVYSKQREYKKALTSAKKFYDIHKKMGNNYNAAQALENIGSYHHSLQNYKEAEKSYNQAKDIYIELGLETGIANYYENMSIVFLDRRQFQKSLEYLNESLSINLNSNNIRGTADNYKNIGYLFLTISKDSSELSLYTKDDSIAIDSSKMIEKAINYLNKSIRLFHELGNLEDLSVAYGLSYLEYKENENYKEAIEAFEKSIMYEDSIFSKENIHLMGKLEAERELFLKEQKEREQAILKAQQDSKRNRLQYLAIAGAVAAFGIMLYLIGKLNISIYIARAIVFLAFIFLFEFILVVIDPITDEYSEGIPIIKFGINLALAVVIFPLHQYFEKRVSKKVAVQEDLEIGKILSEYKQRKKDISNENNSN